MKTRACRTGWKLFVSALIVSLSLGVGAALADGEPTDPDATPQQPPVCPEDPESDLPGGEWMPSGGGGLVVLAVRGLVAIATL